MDIDKNKRPTIGVYTICKNESKFVKQWVESMYCDGNGADWAYVLDTGSTDGTVKYFKRIIRELGIPKSWLVIKTKKYDLFRFDTARNDNLDMIKPDSGSLSALVSVDLDETLIPDFWRDLRKTVSEHPDFSRIYYLYAWNHDENGNPKRVFWYDKVHPAKGCRWRYPVHEELVVDGNYSGTYRLDENKIYLHHWADLSKPRSSYLPLLELRAQEEPDDICGQYYLVREHLFHDPASLRALNVATEAYVKIVSGKKDDYDCLPFFVLAIADIYYRRGKKDEAECFYKKALESSPNIRQSYISYARFLAYSGRYEQTFEVLERMEENTREKYPTWYECDYNWTWKPMQIRAVAFCWAGRYDEAEAIFKEAETKYINTSTDKAEAEAEWFYADWNWLKNRLNNESEDV